MTLSVLIEQITRLEKAIAITDEANYSDINKHLWDARHAVNMMASYLKPRNATEAAFLHGLIDELATAVGDELEGEDDEDRAIDAIRQINSNLKDHKCGKRTKAKLGNLFCLAQ